MSVAAPPPAAFGLREATWKDALRVQWWFLRNLPRRTDMLLAVDMFVVFGTFFALLAWRRGAGPIEIVAYIAGLPLGVFCVLLPVAGALTWFWYLHSPSRVIYVDDNAALVLKQKTVRGQLVWTIGDHTARAIGSGQGAALRARLSPGLPIAADAAQASIRGRAAHPKLRDRYVAQFSDWLLRPEPGSTVNVVRDPQ